MAVTGKENNTKNENVAQNASVQTEGRGQQKPVSSLLEKMLAMQTGRKPVVALEAISKVLEERLPAYKVPGLEFGVHQGSPLKVPVVYIYRTFAGRVHVYNMIPLALLENQDALRERTITQPGQNGTTTAILSFPAQHKVADEVLQRTVVAAVSGKTGVSPQNILIVSNSLVRATEKELLEQTSDVVCPFMDTAVSLIMSTSEPERVALTIGDLTGVNGDINARFEIKPGQQSLTITGEPVASDVNVVTTIRSSHEDNRSIHNERAELVLNRTSAYVDLIRVPTQATHGQMVMNQAQPGFAAAVIITDCAGGIGDGTATESLETMLLGITSTAMITSDYAFAPVFSDSKITKLGMLGKLYDPRTGTVPQKPSELKIARPGSQGGKGEEVTHLDVLRNYVHSQALLAIDIDLCGRQWGFQRLFLDAAMGGEEGSSAVRALNNAVSHMTGTNFISQHPPVLRMKAIPHATCMDEKSVKTDSRRITFLDLMARTDAYEPAAEAYTLATNFDNPSDPVTMHHYWTDINHLSPLAFDGLRMRVFLNLKWVGDVMSAFNAAKLKMSYDGLMQQQQAVHWFDPSVLTGVSTSVLNSMFTPSAQATHGNWNYVAYGNSGNYHFG